MRSYLQFSILLPLVLVGACATPTNEALPLAARDIISSTDVVLPSKQNEIYVFVPDSQAAAAAGGGLPDEVSDQLVEPVGREAAVDEERGHRLLGVEHDQPAARQGPGNVDPGVGQPVGECPPVAFGGDHDRHAAGFDRVGQVAAHALGQLIVVAVELDDVIVGRLEELVCYERH